MSGREHPRWDLVIFDCDGVLVDSEPIANRLLAEMLAELGLPLSFEDTVRTFIGRSMAACVEIIQERLGRPVPPDFASAYHVRLEQAFRRSLKPVQGVEAALRGISTPRCVASSGTPEKIRLSLGLTGLLGHFEGRIFSATQVARGKPFPDLFLFAAREMGVRAERCAVIEDTVVGVQAGVAAGMTVFGFAGYSDAGALRDAGAHTFSDMHGLPGLLAAF